MLPAARQLSSIRVLLRTPWRNHILTPRNIVSPGSLRHGQLPIPLQQTVRWWLPHHLGRNTFHTRDTHTLTHALCACVQVHYSSCALGGGSASGFSACSRQTLLYTAGISGIARHFSDSACNCKYSRRTSGVAPTSHGNRLIRAPYASKLLAHEIAILSSRRGPSTTLDNMFGAKRSAPPDLHYRNLSLGPFWGVLGGVSARGCSVAAMAARSRPQKAKIFSSRIAKKQTSMESIVTYTRVLRHTGEGVDGREGDGCTRRTAQLQFERRKVDEYDVAEPTSAEWYKHFSDERMARHGGGL